MSPEEITGIINTIPLLFIYVVPGYIILKINSFQLHGKIDQDRYVLLKSVAVSFVLITAQEVVWHALFPHADALSSIPFKITAIILAIIVGFFWSRLIVSETCAKVLIKLGMSRTLRPGVWYDIIDFEFGLWVMAYISADSVIYMGKLRRYVETENNESYILFLSNYVLFNYYSDTLRDFRKDDDKWVALQSKDISRVEIFYHPESRKI